MLNRLQNTDLENLLALARERNESAFAQIFHEFRPVMFSAARRVVESIEDGEDAIQEAMWLAWKKLPKFSGDAEDIKSWLCAFVVNRARIIKRRRAAKKRNCIGEDGHTYDYNDWDTIKPTARARGMVLAESR